MSIKDRSGDTIIEVMLVLAVLGLAISISYATANRSLLNARQAQESAEATGLVETQVENLRLLSYNSTPGNHDPATNIFLPSTPYCILNPTGPSPIDTDVSHCEQGRYQVLIYNCDKVIAADTPCDDVSGPNTLVAQAKWPDVLGQGDDTATVNYRVHPK